MCPLFLRQVQFFGTVVDTPVVYNDRGYGPDSAVPGQGCFSACCFYDRCSFSARSLTRPLCSTTGVFGPDSAVLDKFVAIPLSLRQVHMVPDVRKTFGGAADAVLRCWGRACDHASACVVCMAMGLLMGFSRISAFFALLRVVPELSASAN